MAKKSGIADVIGKTLGGDASIAAMDANHVVDVNNMADEDITKRVLQLKVDAGNAILEIGQWLTVMKSRKEHGEWLAWLEEIDIHDRAARRYMRLYDGYSANRTALSDLGPTKALTLLALPEPEREEFVETHDVLNMSTRELEDAIRERDEAKKRAEDAEKMMAQALADRTNAHNEMMETQIKLQDANAKIRELESAPKEVYKDETAIKAAADEARKKTVEEWQKKHEKLVADLEKAESKLKEAKEKAKIDKADVEAGNKALADLEAAKKAEAEAKAEADRLRAELAEAQKAAKAAAVAGDAEVSEFKLYFGLAQENINKMRGLLLKVRSREDKTTGEKLAAAMTALADAVKEAAK